MNKLDNSIDDEAIRTWADEFFKLQQTPICKWSILQGDASPRQYFRANTISSSYILAKACPQKLNHSPFAKVSLLLQQHQIASPKIIASDFDAGFMLLEDLGDTLLLDVLNKDSVNDFYQKGFDFIGQFFQIPDQATSDLPRYDKTLLKTELNLFETWFVKGLLKSALNPVQQQSLANMFSLLIDSASAQPQVFVHRDFHSRNLLITEQNELTTIDYQDAVKGPVAYDLVSLLKDCYIKWPKKQVEQWVEDFWSQYHSTILAGVDLTTFRTWFDWMGLQRHLKVLGIFARLAIRDNKPQYLHDIPRVIDYVLEVLAIYPELSSLHTLFDSLKPLMQQHTQWNTV